MVTEVVFVCLDGLDNKEAERILSYIDPLNKSPFVELPWEEVNKSINLVESFDNLTLYPKGLNVYAPPFKFRTDYDKPLDDVSSNNNEERISPVFLTKSHSSYSKNEKLNKHVEECKNDVYDLCSSESFLEPNVVCAIPISSCSETSVSYSDFTNKFSSVHHKAPFTNNCKDDNDSRLHILDSETISGFKSNLPSVNSNYKLNDIKPLSQNETVLDHDKQVNVPPQVNNCNSDETAQNFHDAIKTDVNENHVLCEETFPHEPPQPKTRSFADVLRNSNLKPFDCTRESFNSSQDQNLDNFKKPPKHVTFKIAEDKFAFTIGKYFYHLESDFSPISLQTCGLINRGNWCYVNATLQALLACPPLHHLLVNVPSVHDIDRGHSSTPVIDSMVNLTSQFKESLMSQEDFQPGIPFQPTQIYDMLMNLKPHSLKGQQEDAEEFLSFLVNEMHEEMVIVMKTYAKLTNLPLHEDINGHHVEDDDGEWQTIGAKQRGMITRKVVEHKTPISDLLGGQTVNVLYIKSSMSASVQPFFALQLDIQNENINTLEDALMQLTVKEQVQGYTCSKTKQEVEAYCRVLLKKLPPVLILHLKRFVYDKDGGCKKVMKHTEYPMVLELKKKELFSPEARKKKPPPYHLFAVMYHEGEEAGKGHYISDIYHYGCRCWIRCDDRNVSVITEESVLSHSPPRVPYLLFYQLKNQANEKN